jgi:parallel beta-helix repeat protein
MKTSQKLLRLAVLLLVVVCVGQDNQPAKVTYGSGPPGPKIAQVIGTQYVQLDAVAGAEFWICKAVNLTPTSSTCTWSNIGTTATSVPLSGITSSTSTGQALHIGNGSTLDATGSGTITATSTPLSGISGASAAGSQVVDNGSNFVRQSKPVIDVVADFTGASVIEKLQAAVTSISATGGTAYIRPGSYTASSCSTWASDGNSGYAGVLVPSGVTVQFDSKATISWTHTSSEQSENPCRMVEAFNVSSVNIQGGNFTFTETGGGSPIMGGVYFRNCTNCTISEMTISSSLDRAIAISDSLQFHVFNNSITSVDSASANAGNSIIGFTVSSGPVNVESGSFDHNTVISSGPKATSTVVVAQSGVRVTDNILDFKHYMAGGAAGQDSIETGYDGLARPVENVVIANNTIYSVDHSQGLIRLNIANAIVDHNYTEAPLLITAAGGASPNPSSQIVIDTNHFFGSGINVNCQTDDAGWRSVAITNNHLKWTSGISVTRCTTSHTYFGQDLNGVRVVNNIVDYPNPNAIGFNIVTSGIVKGNTVYNVSGTTGSYGFFLNPGTNFQLSAVTGNTVINTLPTADYGTGTICSVTDPYSYPVSTTCSGTATNTIYLSGGTWTQQWTYGILTVGANTYHILGFIDAQHATLLETVNIPSSTSYNLPGQGSNGYAYGLAGTFGDFSGNIGIALNGWPGGGGAIQETGTPTFSRITGNYLSPFAGTFNNSSNIYRTTTDYAINAVNGFQIGSTSGATGHVLCSNGASPPFYVDCSSITIPVNTTGSVTSATYSTKTNCAVNSVSPAACGSAVAGAFVVPTTTTTYTVNTTAVTAASRIFLEPMSFAGNLPSTPTCVAPAVTSRETISAISAGTSFTFALPSTTGQTCWQYHIIN